MTRLALATLAVGALLLAGATHVPPARGAGGLAALGSALGGWRVLAVDALYLRAQGLEQRGRREEVPALYRAIVDLDPGNEAATDALAGALSAQIQEGAPSVEERVAWWQDAWGLTRQALEVRAESATLAFRAGDLLLDVAAVDVRLVEAVDALFGGASRREAAGLGYLLAAARLAEDLPRTGRAHLVRLARRAPELAVAALERGQSEQEVLARLAAGEELVTLHPRAVGGIEVLGAATAEEPRGRSVPLSQRIASAGRLVRAALAWRSGGAREPLEQALAAHAEHEAPLEPSLVQRLAAWMRSR